LDFLQEHDDEPVKEFPFVCEKVIVKSRLKLLVKGIPGNQMVGYCLTDPLSTLL